MASLAVLAPIVNKSSDMISLTATVLPKKKAPPAGGIRNRFTKPKPNVGPLANKGTKETSDPTKEKVSTTEKDPETNETSQETVPPVKVEPQTSFEALPTVGALANKNAEGTAEPVKEEVSTSQEEPKSNKVLKETSPLVKVEACAEVKTKTTTVQGRRRALKVIPNVGPLANKSSKETPKPAKQEVSTSQEEPKSQEDSLKTLTPVEVNTQTTVGDLTSSKSNTIINVLVVEKISKALKPEKEDVAAPQEVKSTAVSPETPVSAEVKDKPTAGGRRRLIKATPNIGNKSAKEAPRPGKEKVSTSQEEPKLKEVSQTPTPVEVLIPLIIVDKISKEAPTPEKEDVAAPQEEVKSTAVSQETQVSAEVKAKPTAGGRRRLIKATPTIGNKSAKEAPRSSKEKASVVHEEPKSKEISQEALPPVGDPKTVEEITPDVCEEVAKVASSSGESQSVEVPENEHPVQDVLPAAEKDASLPDASEKFPLKEICSSENVDEKTSSIAFVNDEIASLQVDSSSPHISPPTPLPIIVAVADSTPPDTSLSVVPARVSTPGTPLTPAAHRTSSKPEYPTLKGLLNSSPRKRISSKKNNERKKRFANGAEPPPRSEMTIADLIYYNPVGTAVTVKKRNTCTAVVPIEESIEPVPERPEEEEPVHLGPQVMVNEKGEIVLNEASLLMKRKDTIDHSAPAVIEDENTTYASFRFKASKQWTTKETTKFYKTLKLVGTDFALMEKVFEVNGKVTRTRKELKCKYKREERLNTKLVHQCMYDTQTFEISILENESEEEPDNPPVVEKKKTRAGRKKKKCASPEPVSPSETLSASEQSDEQNGSERALVPSEVNASAEGLQEISVQINSQLYHSGESPAEYTTNAELSTSEHQNGETLPGKKRGRKRKIRVIPDSSESSSWEDASEIYHFPNVANVVASVVANHVAKKSRKARANASSDDTSQQGNPTESVCLSDKNVLNAVELPEHRTDNLCMDAALLEVSTTRRGRKKKVALSMPTFSSFTPAEEDGENDCHLAEENEEVVYMEGTVEDSNFTPVEEGNEGVLEEQGPLVEAIKEASSVIEDNEEEVIAMEVIEDSPAESLPVGNVAMEVAGVSMGTPVAMSPLHASSVIQVANGSDVDVGEQRYLLQQASDSDNVVHVFMVKTGEQVTHPS